MTDATHIRFIASDRSYFSIIKKDIRNLAEQAGFNVKKLADLDLIISEMTSNLQKYATDGEILAGFFHNGEDEYLELICIDHGPGMSDPQKMMTDGFSSSKTLGLGLGSIRRLSDKFDIYSQKDWGTILLSRIYKMPPKHRKAGSPVKIEVRALVITMPGQQISGDVTSYKTTENYFKLLVADGLGHGREANFAAVEAINAFKLCPYHSPAEIIRFLHQSIRKTRGIVGTVIVFDFLKKEWKTCGVGNISTRFLNFLEIKNQMSYNGIIGHNIPHTLNDQVIMADEYHQAVLCSDGIKSRWETAKLQGINRCDMSIQAAAIYKDFARRTDDMSVVMAKIISI